MLPLMFSACRRDSLKIDISMVGLRIIARETTRFVRLTERARLRVSDQYRVWGFSIRAIRECRLQ